MIKLSNDAIWIGGRAAFKPDPYYFKNGMVTYYIEDGILYAQIWKAEFDNMEQLSKHLILVRTCVVKEDDNNSIVNLIDGTGSYTEIIG